MQMFNMPMREVRQRCEVYNCRVTKQDGEYRVIHNKDTREATAYYTDDADDAIGTARIMNNNYKGQ